MNSIGDIETSVEKQGYYLLWLDVPVKFFEVSSTVLAPLSIRKYYNSV